MPKHAKNYLKFPILTYKRLPVSLFSRYLTSLQSLYHLHHPISEHSTPEFGHFP